MLKYKIICEEIFRIEEDLDLFSKKIGDIYFWKLIRFSLIKKISEEKNIFGKAHTQNSSKIISKIIYAFQIMKNQKNNGTINRKSEGKILIFEHPRKVSLGDKKIDIYTHYLLENLEEESYELVEKAYLRKHHNKPGKYRSYDDYFSIIDFLKYKMIGYNLTRKEKVMVKKIERELYRRIDFNINLEKFITSKINHFNWKKSYYKKLIKKRKPLKVYIVVSYGSEPLISACQDNSIEVIEIQHGTMSRYHLGYSFPNNTKIPYFPDKMHLFGEYWYDSVSLPLNEEHIIFKGFDYLKQSFNKNQSINKDKRDIIFLSQGPIGLELSKLASESASILKEYNFIYKLHPGEYNRWEKDYPDLVKANELHNFNVIQNNNISLHELLSKSKYQIGVYSTAVYEGLIFDCKTILMNLNGIEYAQYLIDGNYVKLANDANDIVNIINSDCEFKKINKSYFFSNIEE